MKNKMDADIWTDEWPEFKCTVVKLPVSKVAILSNLAIAIISCILHTWTCMYVCTEKVLVNTAM